MKNQITVIAMALLLFTGCRSDSGNPSFSRSDTIQAERPALTKLIEESTRSIKEEAFKSTGSNDQSRAIRPGSGQVNAIRPGSGQADAEFTLVVSGDVLSHDNNWKAARQADGTFDYMPQFQGIQELLSAGDITLVNLETPVSGEKYGYRGYPVFNAPVNLAETLKRVGVDMVITANNHILDNGEVGLSATRDNLDDIGLLHTGAARTQAEAETPLIIEINGIRTGFAATTTKLTMEVPEEHLVPLNREALIQKKIRALREAGAELFVFHIHWGKEYTEYPSKVQMGLYRILEEEGVDIVIGSHPHRLQPAEIRPIKYQGKAKDLAIIWSTGNLSWGEPINRPYVDTGAVFRIKVERKDGKIRIKDLDYDLIYNLLVKTENGVRHTRIIPGSNREEYKESHPHQYSRMMEQLEWAHGVLERSVDVIHTKGD